MKKIIGFCPSCKYRLTAVALEEAGGQAAFKSNFSKNLFGYLSPNQTAFLAIFLRNRGDYALIQQELSLSVAQINRELESVLEVLGLSPNYSTTAEEPPAPAEPSPLSTVPNPPLDTQPRRSDTDLPAKESAPLSFTPPKVEQVAQPEKPAVSPVAAFYQNSPLVTKSENTVEKTSQVKESAPLSFTPPKVEQVTQPEKPAVSPVAAFYQNSPLVTKLDQRPRPVEPLPTSEEISEPAPFTPQKADPTHEPIQPAVFPTVQTSDEVPPPAKNDFSPVSESSPSPSALDKKSDKKEQIDFEPFVPETISKPEQPNKPVSLTNTNAAPVSEPTPQPTVVLDPSTDTETPTEPKSLPEKPLEELIQQPLSEESLQELMQQPLSEESLEELMQQPISEELLQEVMQDAQPLQSILQQPQRTFVPPFLDGTNFPHIEKPSVLGTPSKPAPVFEKPVVSKASDIIKEKLTQNGGTAEVSSITGKPYTISLSADGTAICCDKLPMEYRFEVFDIIQTFLQSKGGQADKGTSKGAKFGSPKCDENTVLGIVAKEYLHAKKGDSVPDPIFVLAAVLEWAGIAQNCRGYIKLM